MREEELPIISKKGKILINEEYEIATQGTGFGGMVKTALSTGLIRDLRSKGVRKIIIQPLSNLNTLFLEDDLLEQSIRSNSNVLVKLFELPVSFKENESNSFFLLKHKGLIKKYLFSSEVIFDTNFLSIENLSKSYNISQ